MENTVDVNVGEKTNLHLMVHIKETVSTYSYTHYWSEDKRHKSFACAIS